MKSADSGARKKERIRQEKKKLRQETKEYFEKKKEEAKAMRAQGGVKKEGIRHKAEGRREGDGKGKAVVKPKAAAKPVAKKQDAVVEKVSTAIMPLNKFIAHAGICSRRDAAELVKSGKVTVNGEKIIEPGHKVTGKDEIKVSGKKITVRRNLVYILLNKPKDYITTTEDPQGRKTVLDIVKQATTERVYPIGRLDRNTTGVLLLTNDGELAQKLSHPSYEVKKIYEVKLDKPLVKKDFDTLLQGIQLEDGFIAPDALAYADIKDKSVVGIEIHSGRNRIVRRMFEHIGYDVRNLDRVMYANLTKKNVERGKWRFLSEKEVRLLKYLNTSYTKKPR
jgi:pseudouridine synthase